MAQITKSKFWLFVTTMLLLSCAWKQTHLNVTEKIKGLSLVATAKPLNISQLKSVEQVNAQWIAISPYAFCSQTNGNVLFNHEKQWWGEKTDGVAQTILMAKKLGLKIMLKPQLWVDHGVYTGEIKFNNLQHWDNFEDSYFNYVNHFANLADSMGVELFCIGTELKTFNQYKPQFFSQLIDTLHANTNLKLTYAANWDNFQNIAFWRKLDFIGIDAYFPLSKNAEPTAQEIAQKWIGLKYQLKDFSNQFQLPILFTEFGYRSVTGGLIKPWEAKTQQAENEDLQALAFQSLFEKIWDEPWFAGGFVWKWYLSDNEHEHNFKTDFTPQGKKAQEVINNFYKNH